MRVVMVSKAFVRAAYQRKLEELAALPEVQLTLISPPSWCEEGQTTILEPRFTRGYELVVLPIRLNGHFHLHWYRGLRREVQRRRPDIVHIDEEPYNVATLQALRAAQRVGARTVLFTWQNIYRQLPPPFSLLERYVLSHADASIAGSQDAQAVLRRKGFAGPISVIPQFGVDPDLFSPSSPLPPFPPAPLVGEGGQGGKGDDGRFIVGYLGRFVAAKGLTDLVAACAGLGGDWELRLIGAGPLGSTLAAQAAHLGIRDRLEVRPPVPSTKVPKELRQLSAVVLPSRTTPGWREQFGRVLIEAMACGIPVVGSDSGEIPHLIDDAGLIYPEGDIVRLREHLAALQADPRLRRTLAERGRERVLARYTQAAVAAATAAVYRQLVAG